jgi:HEAT repeat protein
MSLFGPPDIAKLKEKGKTTELIKALDYRKDTGEIQRQAVEALAELHCLESVEPIGKLLNELDGINIDLSISCAIALGALGNSSAVSHLLAALEHTKHEANLEKLLELKRTLSLHKTGFDYKLAEKLAKDWIMARYNYMQYVRVLAAQALGKIGAKEAISILSDTLKDDNPVVARYAADALARIGGPDAVKALISPLHGADVKVRRLAARALAQMNIPEAREQLRSLASDKDEIIQNYAESSSGAGDWKPSRIELLNELLELLNFHTDINIYHTICELTPNKQIDQKTISENAVKDSVKILTQKYHLDDQKEIDEILRMASEKKDHS